MAVIKKSPIFNCSAKNMFRMNWEILFDFNRLYISKLYLEIH